MSYFSVNDILNILDVRLMLFSNSPSPVVFAVRIKSISSGFGGRISIVNYDMIGFDFHIFDRYEYLWGKEDIDSVHPSIDNKFISFSFLQECSKDLDIMREL